MMQSITTFAELKKAVAKYIKDSKKIKIIEKAYLFAEEKHCDMKRMSGDDLIIHPLNVAYILTTINADFETLSAALLHEIVEECEVEVETIKELFGDEIALLVSGLAKINQLHFRFEGQNSNINHRKILVGLSQDVRVIIIKLADRLHNMRSLYVFPTKKQKETAKETLDILIPIAHRLGIHQIKSELEDLSLRYSKPEVYFSIVENLNKTKKERDLLVAEMGELISRILNDHEIKNEVKGRAKSIYSIYEKLATGRNFKEIYDLMGLRVFVDTESECYQTLGILHSKYRPVPKRFKDFIAMPKTNMYQSLHTTVFGLKGNIFEIQIRTPQMDQIAEKGIASHWNYKEGGHKKLQDALEQQLQFFRSIIELKNEKLDDEEFVKSVHEDVFKDTIYVFTPKGDVIELPDGSTPIDFAYKVHSKIGEKMVSAIVNNKIVSLNYKLKDQDIIKINTNPNATGPSREWIKMVKTANAKNKIRAFFGKSDKEKYLERGMALVQKELKSKKITNSEFFNDETIDKLVKHLKLANLEEVYIAVGSNKVKLDQVVKKDDVLVDTKEDIVIRRTGEILEKGIKNDIIVHGMEDLKVNIASCCMPILGDDIIGYITRGYGITVHRVICPNIKDLEQRIIDVSWNKQPSKRYSTTIIVYASNNKNLLLDIIAKTTNFGISISNFKEIVKKDEFIFEIIVLVEDKETLNRFLETVKKIKQINNVERLMR